jgi:hypothetical protein
MEELILKCIIRCNKYLLICLFEKSTSICGQCIINSIFNFWQICYTLTKFAGKVAGMDLFVYPTYKIAVKGQSHDKVTQE